MYVVKTVVGIAEIKIITIIIVTIVIIIIILKISSSVIIIILVNMIIILFTCFREAEVPSLFEVVRVKAEEGDDVVAISMSPL